MGFTKVHERGHTGRAHMVIDTNQADAADAGIEVDDSESGDHVEKLRLDLRQFYSLHLDVWAEAQDLDVILQVLRGYNAAGAEVWDDVGTETALTAAASDTVAAVLTAMAELESGDIRPGIYRVAAQRAGATAAGRLHIFGHAKA